MTKPVRTLIDADGVLCDLLPRWLWIYGQATGDWIHADDIKTYGWQDQVKRPATFECCLLEALHTATPMAGSSALRAMLQDERLDVFVTTYCHPAAGPSAYSTKLDWFKRYFPELPQNHIIFIGKERGLIRADYLIDDSPENLEAFEFHNPDGMGMCVEHSYNAEWRNARPSVASLEEAYGWIKFDPKGAGK